MNIFGNSAPDDDMEPESKAFTFADGIASNDIGNESININACPIYMSNLLDGLNSFRLGGVLSDITLVVEEQKFKAHRMLLAIHSDYFKAMLMSGMAETYASSVELKSVTLQGFLPLLDYVYHGRLAIHHENANEVLDCAVLWQAQGALKLCNRWLKGEISTQSGLRLVNAANLAEMYSFDELYGDAISALHVIFPDIVSKSHYLDLSPRSMQYFFKCSSANIPCEDKLLEMVCTWVDCDKENRLSYLDGILCHVRFSQVSSWQFIQLTHRFHFLGESRIFQKLKRKSEKYAQLSLRERIFHQDESTEVRGEPSLVAFCGKDAEASYNSENFFVLFREPKKREQWIRACSSPESFCQVGVAVFSNFLFVCGGVDVEGKAQSSSYMFDPRCLKWTPIASMSRPRANFPMVACGNNLFVCGGENKSNACMSEMEKYSISANAWTDVDERMLMSLRLHAACVIDDGIYISGGECPMLDEDTESEEVAVDSLMLYNTNSHKWTELPRMIQAMSRHTMFVNEKKQVLIISGQNTAVHVYDSVTAQWTILELLLHAQNLKPQMSPILSLHCGVIDKSIFFINGTNHRCSVFSLDNKVYKELDRYEDDVNSDLVVCSSLVMPVHRLLNV